MSGKLYRLGAFAFKKRWVVLAGWLALLILSASLMAAFQKPADDSFSIPGTESQLAFDTLAEKFPEASGGSGRIVFAAPEGKTIADYNDVIDSTLQEVMAVEDVAMAIGPAQTGAVSADGRIALAQVQLGVETTAVSDDLAPAITKALDKARAAGLQAESGGDIIARQPGSIMGVSEIIGVGIAALVLMMTFGTLIAAGMPLLTALIGVGIGVSATFASSAFTSINAVTPTLAIMLGLAVGIDYALFIVTRHRKYLMEGIEADKAAARAISTAGNAVIFAALTVIIALAALSVVGIPFLTVMGLAAAGTVAIAALVAVTLIPALLGFAGEKVLSKKQRVLLAKRKAEETPTQIRRSLAYRWGSFMANRPLIPIALGVVLLAVIALPVRSLELGFPSDGSADPHSTQRKAYDLLSEGFGPGFNGPLLAVAELPASTGAEATEQRIGQIAGAFAATPGVSAAMPAGVSENGQTALFQVIPEAGPADPRTKELIRDLRARADEIAGPDASIAITGSTALTIDVDNKLAEALPRYLLVVVGLSIILLVIVFRSIVIPIKATLGFLLTIAATFGALVALFQWGWFGLFEPIQVVSFLPIIVVGILFGLAMDYEFFLLSSIHEAYLHENKGNAKAAVVNGFVYGSRVVLAAAVIMIAVFAGFIFHHEQMIQMMGFALAFGILVDAFIVRLTIVPAVMSLVGDAAWWIPKWLARVLPKVSIEGEEMPKKTGTRKRR